MIGKIGETAGNIWHTLDEEGALTLAALKKQIKTADNILYMALGWLAREGKIAFDPQGRTYVVRLN